MSCIVEELVDALEWDSATFIEVLQRARPAGEGWFKVPPGTLARLGELETLARALIKRAKEHDCIPVGDVMEAVER